jgi:hypothetical protein
MNEATYWRLYKLRIAWSIAWRYLAFAAGVAALVWITGCTDTFTKPGITQDQANKDRYECQQQAFAAEQNRPMYMVNALYQDCMKARGYTK